MAGWLTLTLISAGFPKMTKIALILLFHVLPILSRYQLPNEGLSLREWRLKVNSLKSPVVIASSKTFLCCTREKEKERSGIERECGRHEGEDPGNPIPWLCALICHLEGLVCWGGDTVLLPSQMINLQNKFSTPSPVPLAGLYTLH